MAFHALLCVRDEVDIIEAAITHLLEWADYIHVYDTGSIDGTLEKIDAIANRDKRVQIRAHEPVWFNDAINRSWLFHLSRNFMRDGDWVVRVDADEFYHELPPEFVQRRLQKNESAIYYELYDFVFTDDDFVNENSDVMIEKRLRWYRCLSYSEPRMFCYRESMTWPSCASFPRNAGLVSRARIPIRHYPHRSSEQMAKKCAIRSLMMTDPNNRRVWKNADSHHWMITDWRENVVSRRDASLRFWKMDDALPVDGSSQHLSSSFKRLLQEFIYKRGIIGLLDWANANRNFVERPYLIDDISLEKLNERLKSLQVL